MTNLLLPFLLLSLIFSCSFEQLMAPFTDSPSDASSDSGNSNLIESQWKIITLTNAESVCFSEAKKAAVAQGYSDSLVFSCKCTASETNEIKSYSCVVSAVDGSHKVGIMCLKVQNQCAVSSEKGTQSYSFDQLENLLPQ